MLRANPKGAFASLGSAFRHAKKMLLPESSWKELSASRYFDKGITVQ